MQIEKTLINDPFGVSSDRKFRIPIIYTFAVTDP